MTLPPSPSTETATAAPSQDPALRAVVAVTCVLSLIGSTFIILIYTCCPSLRTVGKQLLVHISIMTTGLASANLLGVLVNFDQYYYYPGTTDQREPRLAVRVTCDLQSFFAVYFTSGAIMWTTSLTVYLYLRIVHYTTPATSLCAQWSMFVWCYVLPLVLSLWKILSTRLGYSRSPFATEGWCGERLAGLHDYGSVANVYTTLIGYDIWMYTAYILIPVLTLAIHLYIKKELQRIQASGSQSLHLCLRLFCALDSLDYKLYVIPLLFLVLRLWSCINIVLNIYFGAHVNTTLHKTLIYLAAIGDSSQGFVNAVLLVLSTKQVRKKLVNCLKQKVGERPSLLAGNVQQSLMENTPLIHSETHSLSICGSHA